MGGGPYREGGACGPVSSCVPVSSPLRDPVSYLLRSKEDSASAIFLALMLGNVFTFKIWVFFVTLDKV